MPLCVQQSPWENAFMSLWEDRPQTAFLLDGGFEPPELLDFSCY